MDKHKSFWEHPGRWKSGEAVERDADALLARLKEAGGDPPTVQTVISLGLASAGLARRIAKLISCGCIITSQFEFAVMTHSDRGLIEGRKVLLVTEVLTAEPSEPQTTTHDLRRSAQAIRAAGGEPIPYVLAFVNKSGRGHLAGFDVLAISVPQVGNVTDD